MKQKNGEIIEFKGIGTIQTVYDEEGQKAYRYQHYFFGEFFDEDTLKGAREMLDYDQEQAGKIRLAINVLTCRGYKVYKEIA